MSEAENQKLADESPTLTLEGTQSFEDDLAQLEAITGRLEHPDVPLEEAIAQFERGTGLAVKLKKTLELAEAKILALTQDDRLVEFLPPTDEG